MHPGALIGIGFAMGTAGVKCLTSEAARKKYVKAVAAGLKAKEEVQSIVDEAKAEVDDILAEAGYEKNNEEEAEEAAE